MDAFIAINILTIFISVFAYIFGDIIKVPTVNINLDFCIHGMESSNMLAFYVGPT